MVQHMKIYPCNLPYKQTERRKTHGHLIRNGKAFDKIQHPFMIKVLERSGIQGSFLNIIKGIDRKPTENTKNMGRNSK